MDAEDEADAALGIDALLRDDGLFVFVFFL